MSHAAFAAAGDSGEFRPVLSTGIGSWPGEDMADALKITFAECPDLPYLPELPARGAAAQMIGRGTALLSGLAVDLQPAGWRLTTASSRDHRQALAILRRDLDQLEEQAQGYAGPITYTAAGPWTLTAMMERPRGDRVLADHGARRELGQSLAEGIVDLLSQMRRRLPDTDPILQLDEPLLPSVLAGAVPTASGFSRHRVVHPPEVSETYTALIDQIERSGLDVPVTVHSCAAGVPVQLLHQAGVRGVSLDVALTDHRTWDQIAVAMEAGLRLGAGVISATDALNPDQAADRVLRPIRQLGLDPVVASRMVLTPSCGLAARGRAEAIQVLRTLRTASGIVTDQLPA